MSENGDVIVAGKRPKATGVIFKDENGKQHEAYLGNDRQSEVIVSSGALGTPQLLLLSGIGPKAELQKLNIPVVLDNQFVGKGMADNPMNTIFVPSKRPVQQSLIETVGITNLGVYIETSSGFGQSKDSIHCHHGILSAEVCNLFTKFTYCGYKITNNVRDLESTLECLTVGCCCKSLSHTIRTSLFMQLKMTCIVFSQNLYVHVS